MPDRIRHIRSVDRAEWLRLLRGLHPDYAESDHMPSIDAFFSGSSIGELLPSAVFVAERQEGSLGGYAAHEALGFEVVERIVLFRKRLLP